VIHFKQSFNSNYLTSRPPAAEAVRPYILRAPAVVKYWFEGSNRGLDDANLPPGYEAVLNHEPDNNDAAIQ
jgi:hypothetical protein